MSNELLSEEQVEVIKAACSTDEYVNNPVSSDVFETFSERIKDCVQIPYRSKENLLKLYPTGSNINDLLQADWEIALSLKAFRKKDDAIRFPLHIKLPDESNAEVEFQRNKYFDGTPKAKLWYMRFVSDPSKVMPRQYASADGASSAQSEPLPICYVDEMLSMRETEDYLNGPVPEEVYSELKRLNASFSALAHIPERWRIKLLELAGSNIDIEALLNRDWKVAFDGHALRYHTDKVIFPISIMRADGATPVEVAMRHDKFYGTEDGKPDSKPWYVTHVDDYVKMRISAGRALEDWAYIGNWNNVLEKLSGFALAEMWDFDQPADNDSPRCVILKSYLVYTFYKLLREGKVLEDAGQGIAAFNTGLVTDTYEPIYACFSSSSIDQPWRFESFCKAGSKGWGKKLVSVFNPLPERATYFTCKDDLLYDTDRPLQKDSDHILFDNISRLPLDFLREELRGNDEISDLIQRIETTEDVFERSNLYGQLRELIEDESKLKRRLMNRLDDAIELALLRVEWNFKTAVPAFYPSRDKMSLLLPLDLTEDDVPDVALVAELTDSGAYLGQTILTMRMAYNNARLVSRPDSDWLNTTVCMIRNSYSDSDED